MRGVVFTKTLRYVISAAVVVALNFLLPRLMPGDPVVHIMGAEDYARFPQLAARLKAKYGLDEPLHIQFGRYVSNLVRGDLGYSFHYRAPVAETVTRRLKWTLLLVLPSLLLGAATAALAGSFAGWGRGERWERAVTLGVLFVKSLPQYGLAMVALMIFGFQLGLFPIGGIAGGREDVTGALEVAWHAALPILVLSLFNAAQYYLVLRNDIADLKSSAFVVTARARGLSERAVLFRHAFRHALLPFLTLVGLGLGFSVSGALLVEIVFSWPGMGTLILSAVDGRDYPLLQACFLLLTLSVLAANYLADLAYGILDPRVRQPS